MALTEEQLEHDRDFCSKMWAIWKKYGNPEKGEAYWSGVVSEVGAVAKTKLEIEIGLAMLNELKRRWEESNDDN